MTAAALALEFLNAASGPDLQLAEAVERGLPTASVAGLRELGLSFTEVAAIIPPRTLKHRKARGEALSEGETDRVLRVARILAMATRTFGDTAKGLLWLRDADDRLKGRTPLSMLQTEPGGRVVEAMLWQVDEGIYT